VNSPAHTQKRTLYYNLSVSESWGRQKTSQEDGEGMSFKTQGEEEEKEGMMLFQTSREGRRRRRNDASKCKEEDGGMMF
jgi:hypothetical protein